MLGVCCVVCSSWIWIWSVFLLLFCCWFMCCWSEMGGCELLLMVMIFSVWCMYKLNVGI